MGDTIVNRKMSKVRDNTEKFTVMRGEKLLHKRAENTHRRERSEFTRMIRAQKKAHTQTDGGSKKSSMTVASLSSTLTILHRPTTTTFKSKQKNTHRIEESKFTGMIRA